MKKALITGITGQDGSYLAEFLLEKGYEVHGITRRASISNTARIDHLIAKNAVTLHDGDLSDSSSLVRIISLVQPDEIYNLAAQSHVQVSFDVPDEPLQRQRNRQRGNRKRADDQGADRAGRESRRIRGRDPLGYLQAQRHPEKAA